MHYPIILHKDPNSDYGVTAPDLPGCFSAGSTLEEALAMTKDAILVHIESLSIDGEEIPPPSPLEKYLGDLDYQDGKVILLEIDRLSHP